MPAWDEPGSGPSRLCPPPLPLPAPARAPPPPPVWRDGGRAAGRARGSGAARTPPPDPVPAGAGGGHWAPSDPRPVPRPRVAGIGDHRLEGRTRGAYPKLFPASCPPPRASPVRPKHLTVAFLKTHKTAGTTVQNILFRFAERHNLTVALPHPSCEHQFCYPRNFSGRFVHPATRPPHVLASHLRFDRQELARLMPPGTIYVTILREPAAMFESLFSYYNQYCPAFRRVPNASLEAFLRQPEAYYRAGEHFAMFAHNTLAYDLGGDNERGPDSTYLASLIRQVEEVFSLVMIAEYFDESLVLLRRLLAWDLDDVLYAKLNARAAGSRLALPAALARAARAWNALDAGLYAHFNASFWRRVARAGRGCVEREARELRAARERLLRRCFGERPALRPAAQIRTRQLQPWQPSRKVAILGYDLPRGGAGAATDACLKLAMPEVQYSSYLLRKQKRRGGARPRPEPAPAPEDPPPRPIRALPRAAPGA
ncbi:galactose-3-O-sulfotransferase 3 isoform X2 [Erinaceus europaeus]|uniref:Galactose-3-O-sulfotransferase 3 isoform X2 n=1 Tax=Erinaceus europaeus TaxID=9365 RepID=A0ABM3W5Y7_ERIEU|nr:galactose-3-O-sulfotransferase 3 isoform X2 [Erinaceus europaeus]XP_060031998.1 galactose-3-O-sulfotransferase 3 isoform X2 [Erinaceus europaeus]